jgi:hypothetical protein
MSSAGKDLAVKKEPPLPNGWVVCPSKSYPDRVYYFNVFTGRSSWEKPVLKQYLISDDVSIHTCNKKFWEEVICLLSPHKLLFLIIKLN